MLVLLLKILTKFILLLNICLESNIGHVYIYMHSANCTRVFEEYIPRGKRSGGATLA